MEIETILYPQGFTPNFSAQYLHQARALASSTKQVVEIAKLTEEQVVLLNYICVLTDQLEQNACMGGGEEAVATVMSAYPWLHFRQLLFAYYRQGNIIPEEGCYCPVKDMDGTPYNGGCVLCEPK